MASWFPKGDLEGLLGKLPEVRFKLEHALRLVVQRESKKDGGSQLYKLFFSGVSYLLVFFLVLMFVRLRLIYQSLYFGPSKPSVHRAVKLVQFESCMNYTERCNTEVTSECNGRSFVLTPKKNTGKLLSRQALGLVTFLNTHHFRTDM